MDKNAFVSGFTNACLENGVDPAALVKAAAIDPNSTRYGVSKDIGELAGSGIGAYTGWNLGAIGGTALGGLTGGVLGGTAGAHGGGMLARMLAERGVRRIPRVPGAALPGKYKLLAAVLGTLGFVAAAPLGAGAGGAVGQVIGATAGAVKGARRGGRLGKKYGPMSVV